MQSQMEKLTYTMCEVAQLLGIGRNQAYEAARRGDFLTFRIGKRLLASKPALDRMLNGNTGAAPSKPDLAG
jgi:Helix-turn-helix domain